MKNIYAIILILFLIQSYAFSQFVHPGGLHTQADLDRMKAKVAEEAHPWIDGWNALISDPLAQSTYTAAPLANMGGNRQRASRDAHAAYLNAIRWYISEDDKYADCAIKILNDWSSTVNQIPSGGEIVGLGGIAVAEFAMAAEIMRISDRWQTSDFNRFKNMMVNYLYPICHDFLTNHNGRCIDYYWANWDASNVMALVAIGVLCDNQEIFDEGIEYFKNGAGTGSIKNAVTHIHPGNLGQWQETGRDQSHGFLGVGFLATAAQIAWNQGVDLYGYDNNRLLAGAEYVAQYNLWKDVPFEFYNSCQQVNNKWPAINARGSFHDRPVYEMIYNHYVVREGLEAPNTQLMAEIMRPEYGSNDHFGFGTLTFTLSPVAAVPHPAPPAPTGLTATAGSGRVFLKWTPSEGNTVRGYRVQRATSSEGPYETITSWEGNTAAQHTDNGVTNGETYYYKVAGINQAGIGENSAEAYATPQASGVLPAAWNITKIGISAEVSAEYADVSDGTFIVSGTGGNLGGTSDDVTFAYTIANGDNSIIGRINGIGGGLLKTGLMIRENLSPESKAVTMTLGDAGWRFARMGYRVSTSGNMGFTLGNAYTWQPAWFKLERIGGKVIAYESPDGTTWFEVGQSDIALPDNYYIGLVTSSGSTTNINTTTFDNVTFGNPTFEGELLAHYTFDNTLNDISGNEFHALKSEPVYAEGKKEEAVVLNGIDDFITIPSQIFENVSDMTLGMWLRLNEGDDYEVFNIGTSAEGMTMNVNSNSSTLAFAITKGSQTQQIAAHVDIPTGKWIHIAAVLSDDTGMLYLNGKEVGRSEDVTFNPEDLSFTGDGFVGVSQAQDIYLNGLIDDFRIYNTALDTYYIGDIAEAPVGVAPRVKSGSIINITKGEEFQWAIEADYFPTNYEVSGLPNGITLNSATGIISGTAQETGIFNLEIVVENVYGASSSEVVLMVRSQADDGLIAHYRQELNLMDASVNRFHGEFVGDATYAPGRYGFGVELDGNDDYVSLPSGIVSTLDDFTIATWVNVKSNSAWTRIFDFGSGTDVYMFLTPRSNEGTLRFVFKNGASEQIVEYAQPLATGVWRHVAVTLSGNTSRLYVNGNEVAVNSGVTLRPSDLGITTQNYLGKSQWPDPYFQGIIDDFRIYDHALGADEIRGLYQYDPGIPTGTYSITARHSEHVLSIEGEIEEGAGVTQQASEDCKCQVWQVYRVGNSQYNLISQDTELYLQTMGNGEDEMSDLVLQSRISSAASQRFVLVEADAGYYSIISEEQHLALTVRDSALTAGGEVIQMAYNDGANQQWSFIPVTVEEEPVLAVNDQNVEYKLLWYPNPGRDYLMIDAKEGDKGTATIYDLSGKALDMQRFSGKENKIDIRNLTPGTYIVRLQSNHYKSIIRFIKQ